MNELEAIVAKVSDLFPEYMANPADKNICQGNCALCIIDEDNNLYGKLFGSDKIRVRESYKIAWGKAPQVWITGHKTGEYEKLVYTNQINEWDFGILRPNFIGWEGGQPITLKSGKKLSAAFSGLRGSSDLEIVCRAIEILKL